MKPHIPGHIDNLVPDMSREARDKWFSDRRALLEDIRTTTDPNLIQEAVYGEDEALAEYVIVNPILTEELSRSLIKRFKGHRFVRRNSFLCNRNLHPVILAEWGLDEAGSEFKCYILRHPNAEFLPKEILGQILASVSKPSRRIYLLENASVNFPLEILEDWAVEAARNSKIRGMIQRRPDFPEDSKIIIALRRMQSFA